MLTLLGAALLVSACRERAADPAPRTAALSRAAPPTPGTCGAWEETDSTLLAACRRALLTLRGDGTDTLLTGDCGYQQTHSLDSLRGCLRRADSVAAGCPVVAGWMLRQADGVTRRAAWRRCDHSPDPEAAAYSRQFLLLYRDSSPGAPPIFSFSNLEGETEQGIDTVYALDLDGDGSDELVFMNRIYGTGAIFEPCTLAVSARRLHCWQGPDFAVGSTALAPGEVLYKGWIPLGRPPEELGVRRDTRSLWYVTPVYRVGDANCCPSSGGSLWLEAAPEHGRFRTGLLLRTTEDSTGVILRTDTLHR